MSQKGAEGVVEVHNAQGSSDIVLVCEHASAFIPPKLNGLGLTAEAAASHAAWDPGAAAVAVAMSTQLDAPLVASQVSRLVYDCNRPPHASDAMPARSEIFDIPGNTGLSNEDRQARTASFYLPFRDRLAETLAARDAAIVVTIHSFTPVYHGKPRDVQIGILHDRDTRLADAMLETANTQCSHVVQRNAPYGPEDGVTHTLKEHAVPQRRPNVMIEIRNDMIRDPAAQYDMAQVLSDWIRAAVTRMQDRGQQHAK